MIAWFVRNSVAANLLMVTIIMMGLISAFNALTLEVFPASEPDRIYVNVALRGATPEDMELGVASRIEEAVSDLEGIDIMTSESSEGVAMVTLELEKGYNPRDLLDDIKSRVDAISTFPADMENPVISLSIRRFSVITVAVSSDHGELETLQTAERIRDDLLKLEGITQVDLSQVRNYEIAIEASQDTLRYWNLSLDDLANAIRANSLDGSAGNLRTLGGEVLLRSMGQAYHRDEFESIVVKRSSDGSLIRLGDVATVHDGFQEENLLARFNGRQAAFIDIGRVGKQSALQVATDVKQYISDMQDKLPAGVYLSYWDDDSKILRDRLGILRDNAIQGTVLVLAILTLFLRTSVALWVFLGIPVSFLGAVAVMGSFDISLNLASAFGFIVVLGIVVDDAIVTGENVYRHLRTAENGETAAIRGAEEVAIPVTFGVLTTIVAFAPLLFIDGRLGDIFGQIPMIVIPVLIFSLIESKFVLPTHLKHIRLRQSNTGNRFSLWQSRFADGFENAILRYYKPLLSITNHHRYATLSAFIGLFILIVAMLMSGWTRWTFFPVVESDRGNITLNMPVGTPFSVTDEAVAKINTAVHTLQEKYRDPATGVSPIIDILSVSGSSGGRGASSNRGRVSFEVIPAEQRTNDISANKLITELRKTIGTIPGAESLAFRASVFRTGSPIDVQLHGKSLQTLSDAGEKIKAFLSTYPNVYEITDSLSNGKQEFNIEINQQGLVLGLTRSEILRQIGNAFKGLQAQRIQRGRDDVRVIVRLSEDERSHINSLREMLIQAPDGTVVPLAHVANLEPGRGPAKITRIDGYRVLNIRAEVDKDKINERVLQADLERVAREATQAYPDIFFSLEGEAREQRKSFGSLQIAILGVLFAVYVLLALPLRSYTQPLLIMSVIPFGLIGAVLSHWVTGRALSMPSLFGMLALVGVLVNDSLVLVDYIRQRREQGFSVAEAVAEAGVARFRPVMLTSLTTFLGLLPLITEPSVSAQFLIPMALSLGGGILFATLVTMLLIPANVLIADDLKQLWQRTRLQ